MAQSTLAPASAPSDDKRWRQVDVRMRRLGYRPDGLIEVLHTTQEVFGYLDDDALAYVGESLGRAAEQGLRGRHLLLALHPQAAGRAHLRGVHRHRLLHQRCRRPAGRGRPDARGSRRAAPPPTARCRCSRPGAWAPAAWPRRS